MRAGLTGIVIVVAGAWACRPGPARLAYAPVPASGTRPTAVVRVHDSSLAALGLPALASAALPEGVRELRLSRGHGMIAGAEYPIVRIVEAPGCTRGELIRFAVRTRSGRVLDGPHRWRARRVPAAGAIDWDRALAALDSLGIDSLVPPVYATGVVDAGELVVEVRRGAAYRAYAVDAPATRDDAVGRRAAAIAQVLDSLDRLTQHPWPPQSDRRLMPTRRTSC